MLPRSPTQLLVVALIASLLGNQCLCAMHWHSAMGAAESVEHASRPHVHLSTPHKHLSTAHVHSHGAGAHSHGAAAPVRVLGSALKKLGSTLQAQPAHDADAFYIGASASAHRGGVSSRSWQAQAKPLIHCSGAGVYTAGQRIADQQDFRPPRPLAHSPCALYLLHLSIRC